MQRDSIAPSWQGLRIVVLQEFDELFADMTAKIEGHG
jgi:hypothetical protein